MSSAHFVWNPGALELILRGPQSKAVRKRSGKKIESAWKANIHRITGATDSSIETREEGDQIVVEADTARNRESAWLYLEYGTSEMRAQHPGRRAVR